MSGEVLGASYYFEPLDDGDDAGDEDDEDDDDDDDDDDDATVVDAAAGHRRPTHSFYHDLESFFWILLWYCILRVGPAMRREKLWATGTSQLKTMYKHLFSTPENDQLARNKATIFREEVTFKAALEQVSKWCVSLKPLLRQLRGILLKGYMAHDFSDKEAYEDFMAAFNQAENTLLRQDKPLTELRQAGYDREVARRAADTTDWQLPSRTLASPAAPPEERVGELASGSEAHELARDSSPDGAERMGTPTRSLATDFAAMWLAPDTPPRDTSPTELRASQEALSLSGDHPQTSEHPDSSEDVEVNPFAPMPQISRMTSKQRQTTKKTVPQSQAVDTKASAVTSTGVVTRAMRRTTLAIRSSSRVQTRSRRIPASSKAGTKKIGTSRVMKRTQEECDEAQGADAPGNTSGHRKGKEKTAAK